MSGTYYCDGNQPYQEGESVIYESDLEDYGLYVVEDPMSVFRGVYFTSTHTVLAAEIIHTIMEKDD